MRKILLNLCVSLDGYIAGPNGEYDWCFTDADYGMTAFLDSVDALLVGRKSYDVMVQYGAPFPGKTNYVFSRTLKSAEYDNVELVNRDVPAFVAELKEKEGKHIWLFGGAEIIQPLFEQDLIDEMHLAVHPLVLGGGIPLFKNGPRHNLRLMDSIRYPSGLVQLIYGKPDTGPTHT